MSKKTTKLTAPDRAKADPALADTERVTPDCAGMGRIVHYVMADGSVVPAIVLAMDADESARLMLHLGNPRFMNGLMGNVPHDEEHALNSWHWPERFEPKAPAEEPAAPAGSETPES